MTDLTPNHPAVKAMIATRMDVGCASDKAAARLTAALPHLTADDLRDTPAGREIAAEAWDECADEAHALGWLHGAAREDMDSRNPYEKEAPDDHA